MSNLKDALFKAGVKSKKTENMRSSVNTKDQKQSEKHQNTRNFCEHCELTQPDVERFKHKNPTVDAEWICSACADKEEILDEFRMTNQSDFAKQRRYKREFGATKDFSVESRPVRQSVPQRNNNRNSNSNKPHSKKPQSRVSKPRKNFNSEEGNGNATSSIYGGYKEWDPNDKQSTHRRPQGRRPGQGPRRNTGNSSQKAKFTIDEDGEKNFNC